MASQLPATGLHRGARVGLAVLLLQLTTALIAPVVTACIGQYLAGDPHLDANADVIFTGTAVRENQFGAVSEWTFVVDGTEKGSVGGRATVSAFNDDGMCGMRFNLGTRYRVFATGNAFPSQLGVSSTGGTRPIASLPIPPAVEGIFPWPAWLVPAAVLAIALLAVAGVSFAVLRRRSSRWPSKAAPIGN